MSGSSASGGQSLAGSLAPIAVLTLVWGCNWPILKIGVTDLAPLTFRALTLPFAAIGLLTVAQLAGDGIRIPREWWPRVAALALLNIGGWNGFVLFGVQQLPAGRSAILAYTMPLWATLIATFMLHEPLGKRKLAGLVLGIAGMAILIGDELRSISRAPFGVAMILAAAIAWAFGTVLLRKWKPPLPQNTLTGWMMIVGWLPIVVAAPFFDSAPLFDELAALGTRGWFAILYNIFLAGTVAHWAWFYLARTLPVAVSSLSSLPVPVVGVFAGILVLGEKPGPQEWIALALVVAALFIVLSEPREARPSAVPLAPDD
jgi:drug/metabolite transporter (DMT)-like permease